MTVTVTLRDGTSEIYMRFGDAYVKHGDGTLDIIRGGVKGSFSSGVQDDVAVLALGVPSLTSSEEP